MPIVRRNPEGKIDYEFTDAFQKKEALKTHSGEYVNSTSQDYIDFVEKKSFDELYAKKKDQVKSEYQKRKDTFALQMVFQEITYVNSQYTLDEYIQFCDSKKNIILDRKTIREGGGDLNDDPEMQYDEVNNIDSFIFRINGTEMPLSLNLLRLIQINLNAIRSGLFLKKQSYISALRGSQSVAELESINIDFNLNIECYLSNANVLDLTCLINK